MNKYRNTYFLMKEVNDFRNKNTYIFGAGERGIKMHMILEMCGIDVVAFIDNSIEKQNSLICGKKCIDIRTVSNEDSDSIIVISPEKCDEIMTQLKDLNYENYKDGESIFQAYYFSPLGEEESDYELVRPFNFYESPYPDLAEIRRKENQIWDYKKATLEINFNVDRQLELAKMMDKLELIQWCENKVSKYRYYYDNMVFGKNSADMLYYMMKIIKPKRIIEVGSGFSTAVMLDANNMCFNNTIEINCIEPYPARLKALLRPEDNLIIQECFLQDVALDFFEKLEENDILFIDSSHVSKVDSDVNYYLFEILPRLKKGVYIHIHDICYPFIYPKEWIYQGKAYNEMYMLRAFLMNNNRYSIQFFPEMLSRNYPDRISDKINYLDGSIWLRKEF